MLLFFEHDTPSFHLQDVLALKQENITMHNSRRNFNALSFRFRADTVLKAGEKEFHLTDHYLSFVPGGLDYSRFAKWDELIVLHFEGAVPGADGIECFLPRDPAPFAELFTRILDCWNKKELGYRYESAAIFHQIMALCYRENYKEQTENSKIRASVDFLLEHYRNPDLTVGEIAERSFVSEVYFRKLFKEAYGVSPQKYIIRLRMRYAKELISAGYHSLKEIAVLSGYADYKYFSSEFRKYVGVSPSEYVYNYEE